MIASTGDGAPPVLNDTSNASGGGPISSVLLGLSSLEAEGGIACVSRCMVRAFDEELAAGRLRSAGRVVLHDRPEPPDGRWSHAAAGGKQWRFVWQLWRACRRYRPQTLVFDLAGLARAVLLPLPGFPPERYAVFVYGLDVDALSQSSARLRALERATLVLASSNHTVARLQRVAPKLTTPVRVVPLCLEPQKLEAWRGFEDPVPAGEREPAVLIVGRMWSSQRGKGHDQLIEGWSRVVERVPDAELWIAGSGDDTERLRSKARDRGLAASVRFLGRVPDRELGELYRRASVFAMPSRQEGFGLVYAEAMWHGLPCLGSTEDAAGDVIVDAETGLLVPYGDTEALVGAVVRLLSDTSYRERLGRAGSKRARTEYSFPSFRDRLFDALVE